LTSIKALSVPVQISATADRPRVLMQNVDGLHDAAGSRRKLFVGASTGAACWPLGRKSLVNLPGLPKVDRGGIAVRQRQGVLQHRAQSGFVATGRRVSV